MSENPPPSVPDHTLLRPIGRGAYGEVWLAVNVMGSGRAVKIVRRETFGSDRPFEREFAALKRYEPVSRAADGLVNVLHAGRAADETMFYYVMELADADGGSGFDPAQAEIYRPRTLRSAMNSAGGRLPLAECLSHAHLLTQAVASLHAAGLTSAAADWQPGHRQGEELPIFFLLLPEPCGSFMYSLVGGLRTARHGADSEESGFA